MLSINQEKFCLAYAECGNATEAYQRAGYKIKSEKVAAVNATRLLRNASVQARLRELQAEMAKPEILNAQQRQTMLSDAAKLAFEKSDYNAMCKCLDIINKMQGEYVNKTEISGADGGALEFYWAGDK